MLILIVLYTMNNHKYFDFKYLIKRTTTQHKLKITSAILKTKLSSKGASRPTFIKNNVQSENIPLISKQEVVIATFIKF